MGKEIQNFPDSVARMDQLGCEIGNHTYNHVDLTTLSQEEILSTLNQTDELIYSITGHASTLVRPPYGAINTLVEQTVPVPMVLWSVDTEDWDTLSRIKTYRAIVSGAYDGAIILMHDLFETTVEAVEKAIPRLTDEGYRFVTVHELAAIQGQDINPGIAYGEFVK